VKFGTRLKLRLPSKRVPDAIERWIGHYESNRNDGEEWNDFAERVGTGELEGLVKDLSMPVDFELETMNTFIDWNRNVPFEVIRGEGECAV
jgi:sulfite reductase (ferredoxin)